MKHSVLTVFLFLFFIQIGTAQLIYESVGALSYIDLEEDKFKIIDLFTYTVNNVVYDPLEERVYWTGTGLTDFHSVGRDGGCFDTGLLSFQNFGPETWQLDAVNKEMYYPEGDVLAKIAIDEEDPKPDTILNNVGVITDFVIDSQKEWMYWVSNVNNVLSRAKLDGSVREELLSTSSGLSDFTGVALDEVNSKLYYVDKGLEIIYKMDLDGSNVENLLTNLDRPEDIDLYAPDNRLVWTNMGDSTLRMADLNGNNAQVLVDTQIESPSSLNIDQSSGDIYWTDNGGSAIRIERIVGATLEREPIFFAQDDYSNLRNDPFNQKLYMYSGLRIRIYRMNYDGSQPEIITYDPGGRGAMAIDGSNNVLYYIGQDSLYQIDLNDPTFEEVAIGWIDDRIARIEVDVENDRIYCGHTDGKFSYIDLMTMTSTAIVDNEDFGTFALDLTNQKVFYVNKTEGQIRKMNLDGTDIVPIITGSPRSIVLDVPNDRIYWYDTSIFYADLDGLSPTETQSGGNPEFVIVDASAANIDLNNFDANEVGDKAQLSWMLSTDFANMLSNSERFTVQRRVAFGWTEIGEVPTVVGQMAYSFTDDNPAQGNNTYRIRYVNPQGQLQFSAIATLEITTSIKEQLQEDLGLQLFVNDQSLRLQTTVAGQVALYTIHGLSLGQYVKSEEQLQIPIAQLPNGSYVLQFSTSDGRRSQAKHFVISHR